METDRAYHDRRAAEERAAADRATDPKARHAHLELAGLYIDASRRERATPSDRPLSGRPNEFRILE